MLFVILGWLFCLVAFVCWVILLIDAFKNQVWKGILGFFCWLYLAYYGFVEASHPKKVMLTVGMIVGYLVGYGLMTMGAVQAAGTVPPTTGFLP